MRISDWSSDVCSSDLTIECTARQFDYHTIDLNIFASGPEGSWWPQLSVSLDNLTDERGMSNVTTNPFPASDTINYIAPRALVVRLSGGFYPGRRSCECSSAVQRPRSCWYQSSPARYAMLRRDRRGVV